MDQNEISTKPLTALTEEQKGKVVKIWFYDSGVKGEDLQIAACLDTPSKDGGLSYWFRALGIGLNGAVSEDNYLYFATKTYGNEDYKDTGIKREVGWHEFKWDLTSGSDCKVYIDDVLVATEYHINTYNNFFIFDWNKAEGEGSISNVYFDDLTIENPK